MREAAEEMRKEFCSVFGKHLLYRLLRGPSSTIYRMNQQQAWGAEQAGKEEGRQAGRQADQP